MLAALTPPMLLMPPLVPAIAAVAVLIGIVTADAACTVGRPPELPSPPA